ncbi:hypothetical protein HXX76_009323 [Chlamydomonas incerta]|uniref:Uncharacterized protein n=1 Tax=Chlamydomonas incerta TaxID=51695 RepID=A0A835SRF1_CHLIN|nr:hypothetical protein HXX76_009323 [Chlamydomonas incerta]|eukprot:KAG2431829.1 hypothetical protein HXX76_009323 [Chlamydomonas incerta]
MPIAGVLSRVATALSLNITAPSNPADVFAALPAAIEVYLARKLEEAKLDSADLLGTLDRLAQAAQGVSNWQATVVPVSRSLGNLTLLVRSALDKVLNGSSVSIATLTSGRRLMQQPLMGVLRQFYDPALLPDLVTDLYIVVQKLIQDRDELRNVTMSLDGHAQTKDAPPTPPVFDPRTGISYPGTVVDVLTYDKLTTPLAPAPSLRRRLQETDPVKLGLMSPHWPLPSAFTPRPAAERPFVLVPLVFHIMTYR